MPALAREEPDRDALSPDGDVAEAAAVDVGTGLAVKADGQAAPAAQPLVTSLARTANTTPRAFRDLLALDDFERHARRRLPHMIFQYVAAGVETGTAMRRSRDAYSDYAFLPRAMVDTSARSCATELFGKTYSAPFGIGPLGGSAFIAYRGDLVLAEAAGAQNIPMILSASSLIRLEDVHAQNRDAWYQAYLPGDQNRIDRLVDRVARTGYGTFVVTADTPTLGNREHNTRSGFSMPIKVTPKVLWQSVTHPRWALGVVAQTFIKHGVPHFENMEAERGPPMMSQNAVRNTIARDKLCWANLEAIRRRWKGNLLVKGLLNPADVEIARSCGADGVILSTHGGRQLDYAVAPLDVLPEIAANKGSMKVIVDSGIRRGTDVLKAVALGADFVLLGRPFMFAAALGGAPGVSHAISILKDEILRDMAFLGANRLDELGPEILRKVERRG
ncbi:alpha-hydroxy acid oxidase [Methylobacterium brachythecii]|uniref:Alpha-hydroxy-acid oxidizing enzyme n=1 Tax=Methylobacterium brachythecii TaxID=1176177 RepID=A0A7W6F7Q8_9HYPH|nr:alpha-hydroxy acid oxidase [Methylobacterium brachythecii]MBB3903712.1 L-lactate dehydrogenase (cytochrome) [Methylobacterium brachythecii]GLS44281.1 alpha-hydroxy-acid oxidizing enzyme [Methylobacterium brachythecii]